MPVIFILGAALDLILVAINLALWLNDRQPVLLYAAVFCGFMSTASVALAAWFLRIDNNRNHQA